ncbi:hypothetical protein AB0H69_04825 [Streptomyces phaeochromogenes]|uniref:hypothetical protein n=1 Tax=Streptomyces phaeochromogenes TaxID=1923 RepID=UPI00340FF19B
MAPAAAPGETAKAERREERRHAAGQAALNMLIRLRTATVNRTKDQESEDAWNDAFIDWTETFNAVHYVAPDGDEVREQVFEIVRLIGFYETLGQTHHESSLWIDAQCRDAITVLSALLREEPLPRRPHFFLDQRETTESYLRSRTNPG